MALCKVIANSPLTFQYIKGDGHEDNKPDFSYNSGSHQVKRNIDMDVEAKAFLKNPPIDLQPHTKAPMFPGQIFCLKINGESVADNINERVQYQQHFQALQLHIYKSLKKVPHTSTL